MISVLHVIGKLDIGGAENMLMSWYRNVDRSLFSFDFIVFEEKEQDYEQEILSLGGKVYHVHEPIKQYIQFRKDFIDIVKNKKFDIVHCHTLLSEGAVLKCAKDAKIKGRIAHSHSTQNRVKENCITKIYQSVMREIIKYNANTYLACGEQAGEFLYGRNFFKKRGTIINNAIDCKKFSFGSKKREEIRELYNIQESCFLLGAVSRFHPVKNHFFMLELIASLKKERFQCKLILVGDGDRKEEIINKIKELHIEKEVILVGMRKNIYDYLSGFDCLIMPSFHEGFPVSLLEAQANGVSILASDGISKKVKVSDNIQFLPLSIEMWKRSVLMHTDYQRKNWIQGTEFDILNSTKNLEKIYQSCIQ